jgi:hypothetical protein
MKISLNAEFRFNIFGKFVSIICRRRKYFGNVLDNVEDEVYQFNGIKSLETIALTDSI